MKTTLVKAKDVKREWHEFDAADFTLGRLATKAAQLLRGKHKVEFSPSTDVGDFVVVINPRKVKLTGRKAEQKKYYHYSGYPGGVSEKSFLQQMEKHPEKVIWNAVYHMLPPNRLRKPLMRRLKIVDGDKHQLQVDHKVGKKVESSK